MASAADANETQIEKVRQIVNVTSLSEVEGRVRSLNNAQWDETIEDIAEWAKVKNKNTIIKGSGVDIDKSRNRLDIRNRVRVRLGYPEVDANGQTIGDLNGFGCGSLFLGSFSVKKKVAW